jgi:hypothetical protein
LYGSDRVVVPNPLGNIPHNFNHPQLGNPCQLNYLPYFVFAFVFLFVSGFNNVRTSTSPLVYLEVMPILSSRG